MGHGAGVQRPMAGVRWGTSGDPALVIETTKSLCQSTVVSKKLQSQGLPWWLSGKESAGQ